MSACAVNTTTTSDDAIVDINSDICGTITSSVGIGGIEIDGCLIEFFGQNCTVCSECTRPDNSSGIGFDCGFFDSDGVCFPFSLPFRLGDRIASVSINEWVSVKPWQELAVNLAIQAAQVTK